MRILIVDDHELIRQGLDVILSARTDIEVRPATTLPRRTRHCESDGSHPRMP
jgi:DNA-binding NarL/FixJ family response regulator